MKVQILNCKDGQLIQHSSLLYLKGKVCETDGESNVLDFFLKDLEIIQNSQAKCQFKGFNTSFIALAELSEGQNTFDFKNKSTGKTIQQFRLNYYPQQKGNYSVVPLYIHSRDSIRFKDISINNKLRLGLSVIQGFFGEKLFEHGFSKRSFQIQAGSPQVLSIELTPDDILAMESGPLWEYLAMVIRGREGLWSRQSKYVAFMADPWKSQAEGYSKLALGGGGLALMGSDFLKIWPEDVTQVLDVIFNPEPLQDPDLLVSACRFGDVGRTVGSLYAASLGSLAHEMGHIFDLGHSEFGLMGCQFHRMETSLSPVVSYPFSLSVRGGLNPKVGLPGREVVEEDVVSIGHSCATMLYFHRWFGLGSVAGHDAKDEGPELIKEKIVSKFPLTTIQIREVDDGRILKDWVFVENEDRNKVASHEFVLAKNYIPMSCQSGEALVIAQDLQGNVFKTKVNRDILPQSFTVIQRR